MSELKACPFCGNEQIDVIGAFDGATRAFCAACDCSGPQVFMSEAEAITAWNTRPAPSEGDVEDAAKRMADAMEGCPTMELYPDDYRRMARAALGIQP